MANADDQVVISWDEWIAETGQDSGDPDEFIDWALAKRLLFARPQDIKKLLRRQVTRALRQSKRWDEEGGFTYRAKQCVTLFDTVGEARKHYFDIDKGGTQTLRQKSTKQRREAIAHDVYRAVCDVERMNHNFPDDPQLSFITEFKDDVAEHRAAELRERDDDEDAA
ncbi:MAG: hypothetical protein ACFCVH_00610 [Alphaproteobacteria bacterium]